MMDRRVLMFGGAAALVAGGAAAMSFARMGSLGDYGEETARRRAALAANPDMKELVRYATLAANGHNTQPWRFRLAANAIRIEPDLSRRTPVVDPDDHHLFVSLGCAAENLALAAAAGGQAAEVHFETSGEGAVAIELRPGQGAQGSELAAAIPHRQSTRAEFDGRAVQTADLARLQAAAAVPGVDTVLITDRATIDRVRDLVVAGNSTQMADPAFVAELKQWMRFNPRAALAAGDGLFSAASGNPALPTWIGAPMFDLVFTADAENAKYARQLDSSAGVAVFTGARADPEHWVQVGRACQRFALQATALGLKHAFVNQPVEVPALRPELAALAGAGDKRPDIVMRFGYGPELPKSPRRPVEAVLA
jgi:nitroreductase